MCALRRTVFVVCLYLWPKWTFSDKNDHSKHVKKNVPDCSPDQSTVELYSTQSSANCLTAAGLDRPAFPTYIFINFLLDPNNHSFDYLIGCDLEPLSQLFQIELHTKTNVHYQMTDFTFLPLDRKCADICGISQCLVAPLSVELWRSARGQTL